MTFAIVMSKVIGLFVNIKNQSSIIREDGSTETNKLYPYSMYHNSPQLYSKNITGEAYLLQ